MRLIAIAATGYASALWPGIAGLVVLVGFFVAIMISPSGHSMD